MPSCCSRVCGIEAGSKTVGFGTDGPVAPSASKSERDTWRASLAVVMVPLIDTADALGALLPCFGPHPRIAVDTEADSLHCYFEKLCLVQISVPGKDALVDPLAGFQLEPLFGALAGKELILHGADYDLRLLRRVGFVG